MMDQLVGLFLKAAQGNDAPLLIHPKPFIIYIYMVSTQFPIGLKVLAIDSNVVCLKYLVHLLQLCQYRVTATREVDEAMSLLRTEKEGFDIVITNVVRSDMDGFKILHAVVGLQLDIPVIMVSADEDLEMVKRGVLEGAEAHLLKPVRLQELRIIWQHVLRRRSRSRLIIRPSGPSFPDYDNNNNLTTRDRAHEDSNNTDVVVVSSSFSKKKNRVNWTRELHRKFVEAYDQLREKDRVPNNILKLMNDPSLSRDNVASHLQKHRDTLRKKKGSGVGKLDVSRKKYYYDRSSTIYNSMNHGRRNKVLNLMRSQVQAKSSMEQLIDQGGNENPRSTAGSTYSPTVPEFKWFNFPLNFPFNNSIIPTSEESLILTQSFGDSNNYNSEEAAILTAAGQCSQIQFDKGSSLMDDDLSAVLKQHFSSF